MTQEQPRKAGPKEFVLGGALLVLVQLGVFATSDEVTTRISEEARFTRETYLTKYAYEKDNSHMMARLKRIEDYLDGRVLEKDKDDNRASATQPTNNYK